jgi:hypothetical protein
MKYALLVTILFAGIFFSSCEKDPGEGGNASVYGKIIVRDFRNDGTFKEQYPGIGENVYIIYGTENVPDDNIKAGIGGSYEFRYLRTGKYKIYALSEDSTKQSNALYTVVKEVEIKDNDQNLEVPAIVIYK